MTRSSIEKKLCYSLYIPISKTKQQQQYTPLPPNKEKDKQLGTLPSIKM